MYRQGDVLIIPISEIEEDIQEIKRDKDRVVLAYGEATGHAHVIKHKHATLYKALANDNRYLRVLENEVVLSHEEHTPIPLPLGNYKVVIQREYTPEEIRNVAD